MAGDPFQSADQQPGLERVREKARGDAWWFFVVAIATTIVGVQLWLGHDRGSSIGLAATQALAGAARGVLRELGSSAGSAAGAVGLLLTLCGAVVFVVLGVFARKAKTWPFTVGIVLYGIDAAVAALFQAWLALAVHAFVLWGLWRGWRNARQAGSAAVAAMTVPPSREAVRAPRRWRKRLFLGGIVATLGVATLAALFVLWLFNEPPSVTAIVHPTLPATVGQEIRIDVDIRNDDTDAHELMGMLLDDAYLQGVALEGTEPPYDESKHGARNPIQIYLLTLEVPAGTTRRLTLVARGLRAGQHVSELALMFDGGASHLAEQLSTVVLEDAGPGLSTLPFSRLVAPNHTLARPIGMETLGGVFTRLLVPGCSLPCSATETFSTASDGQDQIAVAVYHGTADLVHDNELVGRFQIGGIPPAPRGTPKIAVTFLVRADGTVVVGATDAATSRRLPMRSIGGDAVIR